MAITLNPHIDHLLDSLTGARISADFQKPLGLSPESGKPLMVQYHWERVSTQLQGSFVEAPGLRRFESLLPTSLPEGYADDVGQTRIFKHPALSEKNQVALYYKNEAANPTGSFKDRGLAIGVALGRACGAQRFCLPTQGNAGVAAAFFSSRLGLEPAVVHMPHGYQNKIYHQACAAFGGQVEFHGENIAQTGANMRKVLEPQLQSGEYVDLSTFFEPGRLEGKKTMGFEIWEHFKDALPDWILYPTGGGTGLVGIWKAFEELRALGWLPKDAALPKMVAVQSENCAPVVRAFEENADAVTTIASKGTVADGLDVPGAIMGHRMLSLLRDSKGTAVAVSEADIARAFEAQGRAGISAGYESAALLAALWTLRKRGTVEANARVLMVSTSGPFAGLAHRVDNSGLG